jgi:hypothetical protein
MRLAVHIVTHENLSLWVAAIGIGFCSIANRTQAAGVCYAAGWRKSLNAA